MDLDHRNLVRLEPVALEYLLVRNYVRQMDYLVADRRLAAVVALRSHRDQHQRHRNQDRQRLVSAVHDWQYWTSTEHLADPVRSSDLAAVERHWQSSPDHRLAIAAAAADAVAAADNVEHLQSMQMSAESKRKSKLSNF